MMKNTIAIVWIAGLVAFAGSAPAQEPTSEDINLSRGLSVTSAYQLDNLDAVNVFNGALTVSIPLGQRFPVAQLDYGFSLHVNSNMWDFDCATIVNGRCEMAAEPDTEISNAGLGWTFSFGRLYPPNTPEINESSTTWLLLEGDGSRRKFSSDLHAWGSSASTTFAFTRDGSYLRMHELLNGEREVESPDGTIRVFRTDGRLRQIRDRFNNTVDITYDLNFLTWTFTDRIGRTHVATFDSDPTDPETVIANKRKRLKTLDLAGFGGTRSVYSFQYSRVFIERPDKDTSPTTGPTVEVSLLDSVTLPDGSSFQIDTIRTSSDKRNTFEESGMIRAVTLPTLGKLEWEYTQYIFPEEQTGGIEEGPTPASTSSGVNFKRLINKQGAVEGTWTYQRADRPPSQPAAPPITGEGAFEVRTWVTDPLGHQTVHYFQNDPGDFGYGLPFTKLLTDSSGTRFLSREVFDGAVSTSSRQRSHYLRYETDPATASGNERIVTERTIFHDDGDRSLFVDRSDFDGFGHYRSTTTSDTFASAAARTVFTNFNPDRGTLGQAGFSEWPFSSPWVLNTFTDRTVTEGSVTAKEQFCFEAATGHLSRHRVLVGTSPGSSDVVEVFDRGTFGNLTFEKYYGGDTQALNTPSDLCSLSLPSSDQYRIQHQYHQGARRSSQYLDAAGGSLGFFLLDQDLDKNTTLPVRTRDGAGLPTDFEYDGLGRRTWIKPSGGGGVDRDGWIELVYSKATSTSRAQVKIRRRGNGAKTRPVLAESRTIFDDFGRVSSERTKLPSGAENSRRTFYNGLGLRTSVSELAPVSGPYSTTRFNDYDPFGRPRQIVAPDDKTVTLTYFGIRRQDRTVTIGTSRNATTGAINESSVKTRQIFNRRGDLVKVFEDSGPANILTDYFYDIGDRLTRVKQVRSAVTQERKFNYDKRGFLLSEQHPERGTSGNGFVQFFDYDSRGHAGRRGDPANSLTFTYDRAERVTEVRQAFQAQRVQKEFVYATGSGFSDKRAGKLISATRHNYFDDFGTDLAITESYTYGGREGRVSVKDTTVSSGDAYTQSFVWNELGDPQSLTYPDCLHCPAGLEPARTVSYTYTNGFLTSIPGWVTNISYHPNGTVDQMTHQNSTVWTQGRDPDDMRRPASITLSKGSSTIFATGSYQYDGSGNVVQIGSDYYLYDRLGRLVEGTAFQAGSSRRQTYDFDGFGNLTDITTWVSGSPTTRTVATNPGTNRLSAAGYDGSGAMTSWGAFSYERDKLEMIRALKGDGLDFRYAYTADDERILEFDVAGFGSVWRLRDLGGQVIREFHLNNNTGEWSWQKDWVRREGQAVAGIDFFEGTRYLHSDHLGSTRAITDSSGINEALFHFYPFGEHALKLGVTTEAMHFTGHERDEHIPEGAFGTTDDLDYMHARYYNPMLGRFLRVDPGNSSLLTVPTSWNQYQYGLDNPLRLKDDDGRQTVDSVTGQPFPPSLGAVISGLQRRLGADLNTVSSEGESARDSLKIGLGGAIALTAIKSFADLFDAAEPSGDKSICLPVIGGLR